MDFRLIKRLHDVYGLRLRSNVDQNRENHHFNKFVIKHGLPSHWQLFWIDGIRYHGWLVTQTLVNWSQF